VASEIPVERRGWELAGCLDDDLAGARDRFARTGTSAPILGTIADHRPRADEVFICSIADPRAKLTLCATLASRGATFTNVVHPTAGVAPDVTLGTGIFLYRHVSVSVGATVGDHVQANMYASIGHDAWIGEGCTINSHCDVTGHARLERGAYLGSHAVVLPNARVGEFALVGAGSVVLRSVAAETSVIGVPARRL
jgi:sugar O-acyltransferase (sialic acid O-acetyltransferase NeuD family)